MVDEDCQSTRAVKPLLMLVVTEHVKMNFEPVTASIEILAGLHVMDASPAFFDGSFGQ